MKIVLFGIAALCLAACSSETRFHPRNASPRFGDPLPGTIHVVAWEGFERSGHYYLPKGATLGLLIDLAGWQPIHDGRGFVVGNVAFGSTDSYFLRVIHDRDRDGDGRKDGFNSWLDKKGMPYQHRDRVLLDGDVVRRSGISF